MNTGLKKIVASNIEVVNFEYNYGHIPEDTVIFDSSRKVDVYYDMGELGNIANVKLIIELYKDFLYLRSYSFTQRNSGYGYLEFTYDNYQYTVQIGDGHAFLETVKENGTMVATNSDDGLFIDNDMLLDYVPMPNPYNGKSTEYFFILNYTKYGKILKDLLHQFIIWDSCSYNSICSKLLIKQLFCKTNKQRDEIISTYNKHLQLAGWNRKLIVVDSIDVVEDAADLYDINVVGLDSSEEKISYPINMEGSGFKRFLFLLDIIEDAKQSHVPIIIGNFGEGIDSDKCQYLYDEIKNCGINAILTLTN